jgi:hypothetical protein
MILHYQNHKLSGTAALVQEVPVYFVTFIFYPPVKDPFKRFSIRCYWGA